MTPKRTVSQIGHGSTPHRAANFSSEQPSAFTDDVDELAQLVCDLHQSVLGVQGPPGAGKTYQAPTWSRL